MKNHEIFISYSRKDLQQVISIRDEIKEKIGAESWIDIKGIESGDQFINKIVGAIDKAKVVLFMVSEASMKSEYAQREVMYAKNSGKKVVPVILDNSQLQGWFLFLFGVVDYIDINNPRQKDKFFENMRGWLGLADNDEGPVDLFDVGLHYYLKHDYQVALDWLMRAAKYEYADAQYYIGLCYCFGHGVDIDYKKAKEWLMKAASQNHADAEENIGLLYKHGLGVKRDSREALRWYRKAWGHGSLSAQYDIGKCYYFGRGVDIDYQEAVRWFAMAAENGLAKAMASLGYCYFEGEGVPVDYKKALYWFEKSGGSTASYHIGYCYYHGLGVKKNYKKAVSWFEKAIKTNHAASEYYLGLCYYYGYGVKRNLSAAIVHFRKAVKQGYEEAREILKAIDKDAGEVPPEKFTIL